jgi:hypothetical protein
MSNSDEIIIYLVINSSRFFGQNFFSEKTLSTDLVFAFPLNGLKRFLRMIQLFRQFTEFNYKD